MCSLLAARSMGSLQRHASAGVSQIYMRRMLQPCTSLRPRHSSTEASDSKLPSLNASQELEVSDDSDISDLEEEQLPPWRQLKPWRWQPPEEDLGWLKMFQVPKVQVDEAGRSYIIGLYATGICVFFTFVWWGPPSARSIFSARSADAAS